MARGDSSLRRIHTSIREFSAVSAQRLALSLQSLKLGSLSNAALLRLHDDLLFAEAYPQTVALARTASRVRAAIGKQVRLRARRDRAAFADTGVAGSVSRVSVGLSSAYWLFETFGTDVDFLWDKEGELCPEATDLILESAPALTADAVTAEGFSLQSLFRRMGPRASLSFLRLLIGDSGSPAIGDFAFRTLEIDLRWRLGRDELSRTAARLSSATHFSHPELFRPRGEGRALISDSKIREVPLSQNAAERVLFLARLAILLRGRETDPVCDGSWQGTRLFEAGRGLSVALFSARPERRRPVETYIGFVAFKNGLPIAYGGAWILGECAEIGINVFDEFRGGESSYLFSQIIAVYHKVLGVNHLYVDPYQFGADNDEGLLSGAFWFYYRFGFRPASASLLRLAQSEFDRMSRSGRHSSKAILKRLCGAPLVLAISGETKKKVDVASLAVRTLESIRRLGDGDVEAAETRAVELMAKYLPLGGLQRWPAQQQRAVKRLLLVVVTVCNPRSWSRKERAALVTLLRAKGAASEYRYLKLLQAHARLLSALG